MTTKMALQIILQGILHKGRKYAHITAQEGTHSLRAAGEQKRPGEKSIMTNTANQQTSDTVRTRGIPKPATTQNNKQQYYN